MLYTHNVFGFHHISTFIFFSRDILPCRFDSVTSLYLGIHYPYFHEVDEIDGKELYTWGKLCRIMTAMQGLRTVRIDIISRPEYDEDIPRVLLPLKSVKVRGTFKIHGPWSDQFQKTKPWKDEDMPFVLVQEKELLSEYHSITLRT